MICRDDAVFHDNFLSLFPEYWQRVPKAFQFVFLGHVYWGSVWDDEIVHLAPRTSPWSVHTFLPGAWHVQGWGHSMAHTQAMFAQRVLLLGLPA